jgi:hypothetical protein
MALNVDWMPSDSGYRVTAETPSRSWACIERLTATSPGVPIERARPNGQQTDPEVVRAFGSATPASRHALLHLGRGWETGAGVPVLLVHGATVNAQYWHDPYGKPGRGLAPVLEAENFRFFAVSFAHRHGDNFVWAELLNAAIARVRALTGAPHVDVVAHSKGAFAARLLASGLAQPWSTPYRGDIRRLVLIGAPNLGLDYPFRHPAINWGVFPERPDARLNAPMSWARTLVGGVWVNTDAYSLYHSGGNYFPGQAQMLHRWDDEYLLSNMGPDWKTTYHGGRGLVSVSRGIDRAIEQGGHLMARLREAPLDSGIELAVLGGDKADRPFFLNEYTGPSDGLVFVKSAMHTEDMTRGGARLLAADVLPLNHGQLVYKTIAKRWIVETLRRP